MMQLKAISRWLWDAISKRSGLAQCCTVWRGTVWLGETWAENSRLTIHRVVSLVFLHHWYGVTSIGKIGQGGAGHVVGCQQLQASRAVLGDAISINGKARSDGAR